MKTLNYLILVFICVSCAQNPEKQLPYLNGYWEIKEATSNGITKTYTISEYVDYIKVTDSLTGFKKKVKPTFKETFIATDIEEELRVIIEDNIIYLKYKTPFSERTEQVLELSKDELKVKNDDDAVYLYKRYELIKL